jgi:hypothetical protein
MQIEVIGEKISKQEIDAYADRAKQKYSNRIIRKMTIQADGDFVDLKYEFDNIPFERVRRITGYLVGSLDRFNNGKRAEVEDRVTHSM